MGKPVHSAAASALGYQHQTWWALLLFLLTTADLTANSAGYLLQPVASSVRDESRALKALEAARKASTSKDNKKPTGGRRCLERSGRVRHLVPQVSPDSCTRH